MRKLTEEEKIRNEKIALKRFRKRIGRKGKKYNKSNVTAPVYRAYRKNYSYDIENFCAKNNISQWGKQQRNVIRIEEKTNLFDNPDKVLKTLLEILYNAKYHQTFPTLIFNEKTQFGSLYLIDNMCWEIARKRRWSFHYQNMAPDDIALLNHLRSFFSSTQDTEKGYLLNEKVDINRTSTPLATQPYRIKSKQITDMVNEAVRENADPNFQLGPEAYQAISSTIGEHFDNILLHAPDSEFGYLCGYYDKTRKEISILIFNFGKSIADTLTETALPSEIKKEVDTVIENHTKKKYFGLAGTFTEENALTLLALQEGISSRLKYDKTRGHGIMDFIEHCFDLTNKTKISLISGNTAIKIDDKYSIQKKFFIDRVRRILAFNKEADLLIKPDSDYVKKMNVFFPGFIIETIIPLGV